MSEINSEDQQAPSLHAWAGCSNQGLWLSCPSDPPSQHPQDPCPHLAGRKIPLLKTPWPRLVSQHQP